MSLLTQFVLTLVAGVFLGGVLIVVAHGLGLFVARAEEHRRMPEPHVHDLDD